MYLKLYMSEWRIVPQKLNIEDNERNAIPHKILALIVYLVEEIRNLTSQVLNPMFEWDA